MNIINQFSNYIKGEDKYSMIYTINITCMMVLASVYLSVSSSLPVTLNIKPIEFWLLFNLFWPFLIIISNVVIQNLENIIEKNHKRTTRVESSTGDTKERKEPWIAMILSRILRSIVNIFYPVIYVLYCIIYWLYYT